MNLREKVLKGVMWSAMQNWGTRLFSFLVFLLLARLLEPADFGLVALASVFIAFMQIFIDQGFTDAIVQREELEPEHLNTAFFVNLGVGVLLTMFGIFCSGFVSKLLKETKLIPILQWLSVSFVFGGLRGVQLGILRRNLNFKSLAIQSVISSIAGGVIGVTMALLGYGVWSLVGQNLASGLVGVVLLWILSNWRPGSKVSKRHFKDLFGFGIHRLGGQVLTFFSTRSDDFLIGVFLGPVALGYYSVAYRVLLIMRQLLTSTFTLVALPAFSKLQKEPQRLTKAYTEATGLLSLVAFPVFLGLSILAPEVVRGLFGEQWIPSVPVMQVLCFVGIVQSTSFLNATVIVSMGCPSWQLAIAFLNTLANVVAFAIVVKWGILAVAAAFVVRAYLLYPLQLWVVKKLIPMKFITYLAQYKTPAITTLLMIVVVQISKPVVSVIGNLQSELLVYVLLGAFLYVLFMFLVAPNLVKRAMSDAKSVFKTST